MDLKAILGIPFSNRKEEEILVFASNLLSYSQSKLQPPVITFQQDKLHYFKHQDFV
jgi:hypothetical protein